MKRNCYNLVKKHCNTQITAQLGFIFILTEKSLSFESFRKFSEIIISGDKFLSIGELDMMLSRDPRLGHGFRVTSCLVGRHKTGNFDLKGICVEGGRRLWP